MDSCDAAEPTQDWVIIPSHCTLAYYDVASHETESTLDPDECKRVCIERGFSGFDISTEMKQVWYKAGPRYRLIADVRPDNNRISYIAPKTGTWSMCSYDSTFESAFAPYLQNLRVKLHKMKESDPLPQVSLETLRASVGQLRIAAEQMTMVLTRFSSIDAMPTDKLELGLKKSRESSRQLSIMLASKDFGGIHIEFGKWSASLSQYHETEDARNQFDARAAFFDAFATGPLLKALALDEKAVRTVQSCVSILVALRHPKRTFFKIEGGYTERESHLGEASADQINVLVQMTRRDTDDTTTIGALEVLAQMAQNFANAVREDASNMRKQNEHVAHKISKLRALIDILDIVEDTMRQLLLLGIGKARACWIEKVKKYVTANDTTRAHRLLDEFGDKATREVIRREMKLMLEKASSDTSWDEMEE